jgi:NAD(P)-dependent dehydrogenase (short-subunit alcohol dehydrogenase family)
MSSRQSANGAFRERAVFITGGANGIGLAVARLVAEEGGAVALLDRDEGACEAVAAGLRREGVRAIPVAVDVAEPGAVERAFAAAVDELGPPAGLVTAAGIDRGGMAHELGVETWDQVLAINLSGTFFACREALRSMLVSGGSIVCVSSPFGLVAASRTTAYSASKGGVCALVRALAIDYARHGVRVNAVLPGPTETELMWSEVDPDDVPRLRNVVEGEVPIGRLADPIEPARAIVWLLSEAASYITGAQLACDGGLLAKAAVSV